MQIALILTALSATTLAAPVTISDATNTTRLATAPVSNTSGNLINSILAAVGKFPVISTLVNDVSDLLTNVEADLGNALGIQETENEAGCTAMTVIFARGTTEPGNVGVLTGPPFFSTLQAMAGANQVTLQGVDYPASIKGFLEGGDPQGSQTMANMVSSALASCPSTKLIMSGYSQGGQLVHNAAKLLPAATMAKVSSVIIFGDPDDGEPVVGASSSNTLVICHQGDNVCQHGDLILVPHLTYSENAQQAATFAAAQAHLALGP